MNSRWIQVEEIFHAALALPPHERSDYLDRVCGKDVHLRFEVEGLLEGFDTAEFLEQPILEMGLKAIDSANSRDLVGRTLGAYRIEEKIGEGGMGEVYRATDTKLDRTVALKFLSDSVEHDSRARRQLAKEAKSAAALDHAGICAVFGLEEIDGLHFIVMQHIQGRTLSNVLNERRLDAVEFEGLARQIIEAVAFAHSHGIIHRDLKPGNIMVTDDGRIKILDFGLAQAIAPNPLLEGGNDTTRFSTQGTLIGTVAYMSPEQLRGEKLDFRSDIFSLGIVLHEMLTGENPYARPTQAETIAAILAGGDRISRNANPAFLGIIRKCIQSEKERRFASASELLIEMDAPNRAKTGSTAMRAFAVIAVIAAFLLAVFLGERYFANRGGELPTIVVQAFRYDGDDSEKRYLSEGITRSVVERLKRVKTIQIRQLDASSLAFASGNLAAVAKDFNADAIVTGEVVQVGNTIVVRPKIIRSVDGKSIEIPEQQFDQSQQNTIAEAISLSLLGRLSVKVTNEDDLKLRTPETSSSEAKSAYDKGKLKLKSGDRADLPEAIRLFTEAKEIDPNYAKAWAGLAEAILAQAAPGAPTSISPKDAIPIVQSCATRAIELDRLVPEAQYVLGLVNLRYNWDWESADQSFQNALEIDPNYQEARIGLINSLSFRGRFEEAMVHANEIKMRDPISTASDLEIAKLYYRSRRFDEMDAVLDRIAQRNPSEKRVTYIRTYRMLATGRYQDAVSIIEPMYRDAGEKERTLPAAPYAFALARLGRQKEMEEVVSFLRKSQKDSRYIPAQEFALIYLGTGEYDLAFKELEKSCAENFFALPGWITDPVVEEMKSDPRFEEIRKCAKLAL